MATKWNVSAGPYISGKGWAVNRDHRREGDAKRYARLVAEQHPDWATPVIRKMGSTTFPGLGTAWMEEKQYPWPQAS